MEGTGTDQTFSCPVARLGHIPASAPNSIAFGQSCLLVVDGERQSSLIRGDECFFEAAQETGIREKSRQHDRVNGEGSDFH